MDEYVKFHNQTAGRDKFFRLVQYMSRVIWSNLERRKANPLTIEKAKRIDEILGLMRRILRFGRFFETLHSALPMISSTWSDTVIRFTIAMSRISNACFMFIDHVVCLDKLGLLPKKLIDSARWDRWSTKFWLYAILLGLIRDFYEIKKIYKAQARYPAPLASRNHGSALSSSFSQETDSTEAEVARSVEKITNRRKFGGLKCFSQAGNAGKVILSHADVAVDSTKNICDLCIPLNSLGFIKLSPGTIGMIGVASTILSAIPQINPLVKMVPGA